MARVIFLAGAPEADSLTWDEGILLPRLQPPARRFLGEDVDASDPASSTSFIMPKWRVVPCDASKDTASATLHGSPRSSHAPPTQFLAFDEQHDATQRETAAHLDFLEHSLALLTAREEFDDNTTAATTSTLLSFSTDSDITTISTSSQPLLNPSSPPPIVTTPLTDLISIPSAAHLRSLHPQTPTINLLGAVIRIEPPRTVTLRRNRQVEKELLSILLGDETRANFSVTFWFPVGATHPPAKLKGFSDSATLRARILALTPGTVVFMRNIALSEWNGAVYGCSLMSRGFAARGTSSTLSVVRGEQTSWGWTAQAGVAQRKLDRVRDWRDSFVGRSRERDGNDRMGMDGLPVDATQVEL